MKKRPCVVLLSLILCSCLSPGLMACGGSWGNANNNHKVPDSSQELLAPHIMSFGSYLSWSPVSGATSYEIYRDNTLIQTQTDTTFRVGDLDRDSEFYILAQKNTTGQSAKSNVAVVSKNCNFADSEILDLSEQESCSTTIDPMIRKIVVHKANASFDFECDIAERTTDLTFDLANVTLNGSIHCGNGYSRLTNDYNVIFNITGSCSLMGITGTTSSIVFEDDSEKDGIDGTDGEDALIVPTVIMRGDGEFGICGGDGGNGSKGASTTTTSSASIGVGSNGGNGGAAVKTQYFIMEMSAGSFVTIKDGNGGKKGSPGDNNSIITGPLISMMWADVYDIGKNGADGKSVLGSKIITSGKLNY